MGNVHGSMGPTKTRGVSMAPWAQPRGVSMGPTKTRGVSMVPTKTRGVSMAPWVLPRQGECTWLHGSYQDKGSVHCSMGPTKVSVHGSMGPTKVSVHGTI